MTTTTVSIKDESGMTLIAVMIFMTAFAFLLMMAAPSVYTDIQREKELESIRRGEEVMHAIHQYFMAKNKLPESMDDLLEGLPDGTKKRQILRPSAATDPLSLDGRWRLIQPKPEVIARLAKRIQTFNNGLLPSSPGQNYDKIASMALVNVMDTGSEDEDDLADDDSDDFDGVPFIGVASQSRSKSVLMYYGIEKHSQWIYTPLFRGEGSRMGIPRSTRPNR